MRSDAIIFVHCDICKGNEVEVPLTAIACGGYDERNVDNWLIQNGWDTENGETCPDCKRGKESVPELKIRKRSL